jgi:hypothetical protein
LSHVNGILKGYEIHTNINKIDNIIFEIFKINLQDRAYIKNSLK